VGAIIKRLAYGRQDGVAVLAEGLVEILPESDLKELAVVERDAHDHIRIAEINFGDIVKGTVQRRLAELGIKATLVPKNIGYEVRCADPIPFDMEYTRDLGYCGAKFLIEGGSGALISIQQGRFRPVPFDEIMNPRTGRMRVRLVDVSSDRYRIAYAYMLRLKRVDFDDPAELARLAAAAGLTPAKFREEFGYLVDEQSPLSIPPTPFTS
jgi:6-phosphofructokinase 1